MLPPITPAQLKKLQTLWGIYWRMETRENALERPARIGWIAGAIGRQISSTKDLTKPEAERAIAALAKMVPAHLDIKKKRPRRRAAQELGTAGKRGVPNSEQMVGAEELRHIQDLLSMLGWNRDRFEAWLRSRHSPLHGRSEIRTMGDANRVRWGLKHIARLERRKAITEILSGQAAHV